MNTINISEQEKALEDSYCKGSLDSLFEEVMKDPELSEAVNRTSQPEITKGALKFLASEQTLPVPSLLGFIANRFARQDSLMFKCLCASNSCEPFGVYHTEQYFKENIEQPVSELFSQILLEGLAQLDAERGYVVSAIQFSEAERIDISKHQRPFPMVEKPRRITKATHTAYLSNMLPGGMFCRSVWSDYPEDNDSFMLEAGVDVINMMNSIPYSINEHITETYVYRTKNPLPLDQLQRFREQNSTLAKLYTEIGHLYLSWAYDNRGRFYDNGYQIKVQGTAFQKNQLEFTNKEILHD